MSFDSAQMRQLIQAHGRVARVVVASTAGSVPREVGASMAVWATGQSGTIGGGALEFDAAARARAAFATGDRFDKVPLGPDLGQCCGGAVSLLTEVWDAARLAEVADVVVRRMPSVTGAVEMPLKVRNRLKAARNCARPLRPEMIQGWMLEPVSAPTRRLWLWGAGHVGRAIVDVMAPLPEWEITWLDTARDRFPDDVPGGVIVRAQADSQALVSDAPADAEHLILTFSHALDLELCHRLLARSTGSIGLIGSATKWARFRKRLLALGHTAPDRIQCPIGDPELGKHPQAIALGVAAALLRADPAQVIASEA